MSIIKQDYGEVSGTFTETKLWTNSSPTTGFTSQNVTLSSDINNFDYIKVVVIHGISSPFTTRESNVLVPISDFISEYTASATGGYWTASGSNYFYQLRPFYYVNGTTIKFGGSMSTSGSSSSNSYAIPKEIYGIKLG